MDKFCEILKDLIEDKSLSLRKIEKECGISSSQLSRYKNGIIPTIDILIKLSNYFDCSIDYLVGMVEDRGKSKNISFDLNKFIDNYIHLLKCQNITHWKFAKNNNFNEACLRHWKNGEIPKTSTLIIIALGLGVTIEELIF